MRRGTGSGTRKTYRSSDLYGDLGHLDIGLVEIARSLFCCFGAFEAHEANAPFGQYMGVCDLETT